MRMIGENVRLRHLERGAAWECLLRSPDEAGNIFVGTRDQFSGVLEEGKCPPNDLDDEILVTERDGDCLVTGSNPRSVLFSAYDLLDRLGARWVGPGYLGEVLPESDCSALFKQEISERASYRHRGVCIEGAPSLEHALGVIDWMAKHKMNTFFLQFKTSIYFWRNYYSRKYNERYGEAEEVDEKRSLELDGEVIDAARLRDMVIHRVGHGWTAESIGFPSLGWYEAEREPDEHTRSLLAQVGGKREFFGNTPINTELCYSNPEAFDGIVEEIAGYASEHPEVDCLHFWLSDATNNFCECDGCTKVKPSDWYARLIRAVAQKVRDKGLGTRIVFLCYTNTMMPPISECLSDIGERLIYMFAPISRCYVHPLADPSCSGMGKSGGWPLNRVKPPRTNAEFVKIRRGWLKAFDGDSFIFDYYLWNPYIRNLNPIGLAGLINSDVRSLADLDLNGLVSCQALRAFYPIGLPMVSMAETLWNRDVDLESLIDEHLDACFGINSTVVKNHLTIIGEILSPTKKDPHKGSLHSGDPGRARKLIEEMNLFSGELEGLRHANDREKRYLDLLKHYNDLLTRRAKEVFLRSTGQEKEADQAAGDMAEFLRGTEDLTHRYLDLWLMLRFLRR